MPGMPSRERGRERGGIGIELLDVRVGTRKLASLKIRRPKSPLKRGCLDFHDLADGAADLDRPD